MRISIFFLILFVYACSSTKEAGYSKLLEVKEVKPKPVENLPLKYQFFQYSGSECKLYYSVEPEDFLSIRDSSGNWSKSLTIELTIKEDKLGKPILLEQSRDTLTIESKRIVDSFVFQLPERKDLVYEISIIDQNKHVFQEYSDFLERQFDFIPEDISLWNNDCDCNAGRSFIALGKAELKVNKELEEDLKLEIYQNVFSPAELMYSISSIDENEKPNVINEFVGTKNEIQNRINELKTESYCRIVPNITAGDIDVNGYFEFTVQHRRDNYSIDPLIYLVGPDNKEVSINTWTKYWAKASNNDPVRAEKLIREFNNRVDYANLVYSSFKIGWKTDRGMMHILYGKPDLIQNDVRGEIWIYGFADVQTRQFIFERNPKRLHKNDYVLERSMNYREIWQSAMLKWENGWINDGSGY